MSDLARRVERKNGHLTPAYQDEGFYAGLSDINPRKPCPHPPGTYDKVRWLAARYMHHVLLWDGRDNVAHAEHCACETCKRRDPVELHVVHVEEDYDD